jgi:hypothetical protein
MNVATLMAEPDDEVTLIVEEARRLTAGEEKLSTSQLADQLRQSGIDPEALKQRLHEAVKGIAARERAAGRVVPLAVQQAIKQTIWRGDRDKQRGR